MSFTVILIAVIVGIVCGLVVSGFCKKSNVFGGE